MADYVGDSRVGCLLVGGDTRRVDGLRWLRELAEAVRYLHGCTPPIIHWYGDAWYKA